MDNQEKLFRLSIALNELYKHGKATVLKGETLNAVKRALTSVDINYKVNHDNDSYSEVELID